MLKLVRSPGEIKISVNCWLNGTKVNDLCSRAINSRRAAVRVACLADLTVKIRVSAKAEGMRRNTWIRQWSLDQQARARLCTTDGDG